MDKEQILEKHGKVYEPGTILFNEGDIGTKLWVINSGRVRLTKYVCGDEIELDLLGPGEFCGELALLQRSAEPVTATVVETSKLIAVDAQQFETLIRNNGELAMRMLKKMSGRLCEAQFRISVLQMRTNMGRVMLQLRAECGNQENHKATLPANLSNHLGLDEVELSEVLNKLQHKKLIILDKDGMFSIPDLNEFERYMRFLELNDRYDYLKK